MSPARPPKNSSPVFSLHDLFEMTEDQRRELYEMISRELFAGEIAGLEHRIVEEINLARIELEKSENDLDVFLRETEPEEFLAKNSQHQQISEWLNQLETLPIEMCKSRGAPGQHHVVIKDGSDYTFSAGPLVGPDESFYIEFVPEAFSKTQKPCVTLVLQADHKVEVQDFDGANHLAIFSITTATGVNYKVAVKGEVTLMFTAPEVLDENHFRKQDLRLLSRIYGGFDTITSLAHRFGISEKQSLNALFPPLLNWNDQHYETLLLSPLKNDFLYHRQCLVKCGDNGGTLRLTLPPNALISFEKETSDICKIKISEDETSVTIDLHHFNYGQKKHIHPLHHLNIQGGKLSPDCWTNLVSFAALSPDSQWVFLAERIFHEEQSLFQKAVLSNFDWMSELAQIDPHELLT